MNDSAAEVAKSLPHEVATSLHAGTFTLPIALMAEALGLLDVLNLSGMRWSPSLTSLGREVWDILEGDDA